MEDFILGGKNWFDIDIDIDNDNGCVLGTIG